MLASSRPLLLPSFSTKRGSTEDALETKHRTGFIQGGDQALSCSSAGWPVRARMAPGPEEPASAAQGTALKPCPAAPGLPPLGGGRARGCP